MSRLKIWAAYDEATQELLGVFPTEDEAIIFSATNSRDIVTIPFIENESPVMTKEQAESFPPYMRWNKDE